MSTRPAGSLSLDRKGVDKSQPKKQQVWAIRGLKIGAILLGMAALLVVGYYVAKVIALGPVTTYRLTISNGSDLSSYKLFPQRMVTPGGPASPLKQASPANFPTTVTYDFYGQHTAQLDDLFTQTDTQAFIVIRDNTVIYEKYLKGTSRDTLHTSFSMAKSFTSALIGIAIDEGKIKSVDDPLITYVPELKGRGFDALTLRDMLIMSSGLAFRHDLPSGSFFGLFNDFYSDDAQQYFTDDIRRLLLKAQRSDDPIGADFHYNDFYPLLEGLILQRATGESVAQYTQDKLWQPMGAEYPASWSLDSTADGFEKTNSAFNARAIDFARIGLVFLNQGRWNGHQIISQSWVSQSTTPDPSDQRSWKENPGWQQAGGYYKYHWWGLNNPDGTYDYMANGKGGQFIYISPSTNTVVVRLGWGPQPIQWPFIIRSLIHSLP